MFGSRLSHVDWTDVCNPDTPTDVYNTGDTWFPSNSSRLIVDDGLDVSTRATYCAVPKFDF